ncbi:hypothetical protein F4778DRAFT_348699 [Xylariomycetidae sp. FL2044]|nr:hypothetical protein F4778DRAFT_348699 [Xylariomycetidae sp. FL2044]
MARDEKALDSTVEIAVWLCLAISIILCIVRLSLRVWKWRCLTRGDGCVLLAMLWIGALMGAEHFTTMYGTPLDAVSDDEQDPTPEQKEWLAITGKLALVIRLAFVFSFWALKVAVLDLEFQLLPNIHEKRSIRWSLYGLLAVTFIASFTSIFVECRPLRFYWEIHKYAEQCADNELWMITYEICNAITDTVLLVISIPIIYINKVAIWKRLRLTFIFGMGLFLIAINILRLCASLHLPKPRIDRGLWGGIEIVVASIVATLPTIYTLLRPQFQEYRDQDWPPVASSGALDMGCPRSSMQQTIPEFTTPPSSATGGGGTATNSQAPGRLSVSSRNAHTRDGPSVELSEIDTRILGGKDANGLTQVRPLNGIMVETEINQEVQEVNEAPNMVDILPLTKSDDSPV